MNAFINEDNSRENKYNIHMIELILCEWNAWFSVICLLSIHPSILSLAGLKHVNMCKCNFTWYKTFHACINQVLPKSLAPLMIIHLFIAVRSPLEMGFYDVPSPLVSRILQWEEKTFDKTWGPSNHIHSGRNQMLNLFDDTLGWT